VVTAVSDFGHSPFFVGVIVTIAFSAVLGLFWGAFGWIYEKKKGANLLLACVIVALEIIRSNILSGFPMLNLAHTQYSFAPAIQIAEVTGEFGVSLIIAYVNLALAAFFVAKNKQSILLAGIMLAASLAYGFSVQNRDYAGNDLKLRIIQPAYSQADKWNPDKKFDIIADVGDMMKNSEAEKYDLVILPETVFPAFLNKDTLGYTLLTELGQKTNVIAGGIRRNETEGKTIYNNSVFFFDKDRVSIYDKLHLVPFGEYFPLKTLFKPIDYYFFKGAEDFTAGESPVLFTKDKFSIAPMICYESMYSSMVRAQALLGSDIITVVTNDSWFGSTKGPYQHMASDVFRAVEFRKPVIRAAQSGISACIDSGGHIQNSLPTNQKGYMDCTATTHKGLTIFATGGYGWLAIVLFASWYFTRRKNQ
jgi:apolipoprotein N-acyltransferase